MRDLAQSPRLHRLDGCRAIERKDFATVRRIVVREDTNRGGIAIVDENIQNRVVKIHMQRTVVAVVQPRRDSCPIDAIEDTRIVGFAADSGHIDNKFLGARVEIDLHGAVVVLQKIKADCHRIDTERQLQLHRATLDGRQALCPGKSKIGALHALLCTERLQPLVRLLAEVAIGVEAQLTGERIEMGITERIVKHRRCTVGHNTQGERLATILKDRGREHTIAVACQTGQLKRLRIGLRGLEMAGGIDRAHPIERTHTIRGGERRDRKEPTAIAHRRNGRHLPEIARIG